MHQLKISNKPSILNALKLVKSGDIDAAQKLIGFSTQINRADFVNGMMSLEQGLELIFNGHHPKAVKPLRNALLIVNQSTDDEAKFFLATITDFAEGISKLLSGDAHGAVDLLDISTKSIERISFFITGFEKIALSFQAASKVALARTFINAGNISEAEFCFGEVNQIHENLMSKLNKSSDEDNALFAEIFGTRIEISNFFYEVRFRCIRF